MLVTYLRTYLESYITSSESCIHPSSQDMYLQEITAGLPALKGSLATPLYHSSICKRLFAADDPCLPGIGCRLGAVDQVQFAENVADMPLDSTHTDDKLIGDLVI